LPPTRSIVLCAVPGAGGTAVAEMLGRRGAGDVRAYFDLDTVARPLLARWEIDQLDEYIAMLHRCCTTPQGVFGVLLGWHDVRQLLRRVVGPRQSTPKRVLEIIEVVAPEPTFVRLTRTDRASHVIALRDWQQRSRRPAGDAALAAAPDDPSRLDALIEATEAVWTQWFEATAIEPVEVTYEQLINRPDAQRDLAIRLGLGAAAVA
jgi:LPS sulfotransferase NodH